jgi:hypothetical protein
MRKLLKEEWQDPRRRGIITPVEGSMDWIRQVVVAQKQNRKPSICIDPRPWNKALKRSHLPLPTTEDLLPFVLPVQSQRVFVCVRSKVVSGMSSYEMNPVPLQRCQLRETINIE